MEVALGFIAPLNRKWMAHVAIQFYDRGEAEDPRSEWPILDGDFDQTQLPLGLVRLFDIDDDCDEDRMSERVRHGPCGDVIQR